MSSGLTILQVLSWLNYGGVESYALRLGRALQARGHRVIVASAGGQLEPEFAAAGIAHFRVDFTGGKGFSGTRALRRLIEREQVDLVNAHNWRAGMISHLATRRSRVPYVLTVHGTRQAVNRFWVFYWSQQVVVVSAASKRNLVEDFGLPEERVVETIVGVDCERFRPEPPDPELERELGLSPGAPRVVHVSRFSHSKAPVALALTAAVDRLARLLPEVELVLVGQGPEEKAVARAAEQANARLGRRAVFALGGRGDVPRLLNLATVVVATATVALEAMACGKPVLAAGKGGYFGLVTPERLREAEASCFADHGTVAALTAEKLGESLAPLLRDPVEAKRLGEWGRRTAATHYGAAALAQQMEQVYHRALCDPAKVKRIAVFHLNQIGDLIFTLPALKALREGFPEAHITSVLRPHLAGLVASSGYVNRIEHRLQGRIAGPLRLTRALRRERPDLAVALSQSATMTLCARLSGAPHRLGFLDADLSRLLNHRVQERGIPCPSKVLHLVRCLGLEPEAESYVGLLHLSPEDREAGQRLLSQCALSGRGPLIALAPGESTDRPYKSWSATGFAAVAARLTDELEARLLLVGGGKDHALAEEILSGAKSPDPANPTACSLGTANSAANLCGKTTPSELAAVLSHCDLLIGIDSGPMHVAAAMGRPVVGLFGPTDPGRTGPQGEGHQIIFHRQPCWPCQTPTCQGRPCMAAISVEEVLAAVHRALAAERTASA